MDISAPELLNLSQIMFDSRIYDFAYVLGLAASQSLSGKEKAKAYFAAANAKQYSSKLDEAEEYFKKAINVAPQN